MTHKITIKSIVKHNGRIIHESVESDGSYSIEFYAQKTGDCVTESGERIFCKLAKVKYTHKNNTVTLTWQKVNGR